MKKLLQLFLICTILLTGVFCFENKICNAKTNEIKIQTKYAKVLNKNEINKIELVGTKSADSPFFENIKIYIKNKNNKILKTINPKTNYGYNPSIIVEEFTANGLKDIFLTMDSGGSGGFGYNYLYGMVLGKLTTLFDYEKWPNNYIAKYIDNYKVEVKNTKNNKTYIIDISSRDKNYLSQIYNENGKLIKPLNANVSDVTSVFAYYNNYRKQFQLQVFQRVWGLASADSLGNIITLNEFSANKIVPYYTMVGIN